MTKRGWNHVFGWRNIRMCSEGEVGTRTYLSGSLVCTSDLSGHQPISSEDIIFGLSLIYQSAVGERILIGPLRIVLTCDWVKLKCQHNVT